MTVIAVAGEVDMSNSGELRRAIADLISHNPAGRVALYLSELTFMGSAGIRVLLVGRALVEKQGGQLEIILAHQHVIQVLTICGLTDLFHLSVP
ncbi:STAS domain-containing protein [Actinoplanes sp. KI2]|uniref:STAS domain-containing protein n=1 Tax=Actinoplanes sp. KI2 TaxID=2983315 RepID=UPI0021D5AFA1|nr:STAS domain-containing protein [Actinoplanes sp. KI2]MCU7730973.1 STAS domain-containing protein [Actinoplanes sp. KI2]